MSAEEPQVPISRLGPRGTRRPDSARRRPEVEARRGQQAASATVCVWSLIAGHAGFPQTPGTAQYSRGQKA